MQLNIVHIALEIEVKIMQTWNEKIKSIYPIIIFIENSDLKCRSFKSIVFGRPFVKRSPYAIGPLLVRLQTWRALIFSRVCLCVSVCLSSCPSVCLWPALLPFNVDRFWRNLVARTLLWFSLAATIMVQIGCRRTARRLCENFKKFFKITEFEFQNSGPSFFAFVFPVYCKKWIRFEQNWRRR